MKKGFNLCFTVLVCIAMLLCSCGKDKETGYVGEEIPTHVDAVNTLMAGLSTSGDKVTLMWVNPEDTYLDRVEIAYEHSNGEGLKTIVLLDAKAGQSGSYVIALENPYNYVFAVTAINKAGFRSEKVLASIEGTAVSPWVNRADTLMKALVKLYLDGKARDIWSSTYPQSDGYWDGAAVIWGHGGAFSGYTAFKEATWTLPKFKQQIENLYDNRLLVGIDKFRNTRNGGPEAYAVYPGDGDERFYDDNIWVGIDMAKLYVLTKDQKYLDRAKIVWNFVLSGSDDVMGGGVYWKEGLKSKHTCSTFPAAVLALKLYEITNESAYLEQAKKWYTWGKNILQDPADYLFWDNARLSDENDPNSPIVVAKEKYSYNTGQPMQVAALLYKFTNDASYLQDAQQMAKAAYAKWFVPFRSYVLHKSFYILEPGHVWFQAIMMRGFMELYRIDHNRTYLNSYEDTLLHAWLSPARNKSTHLINTNFWGTTVENKWEILHEGAVLEMISQLALLDQE